MTTEWKPWSGGMTAASSPEPEKRKDEPMKLSELDNLVHERRELVKVRSVLSAEEINLTLDAANWTYGVNVPESLMLAATTDLLERSEAQLEDIDRKLREFGVIVDLPIVAVPVELDEERDIDE